MCCKWCCFGNRTCSTDQVRFCDDAVYNTLHRILDSILIYIHFCYRREEQIGARRLAPYLSPESRNELYLVVGELHHPKRPQPAATPQWLIVPERGLFTGIAIFGAVGSGKTSGSIYPFAEQALAYRAEDAERRVAGLVLEVKGDFCHKVRGILEALSS